eukprot:08964.XXX_1717_2988_1 [CDS] Oithona nana genome sequencing.
MGCVYSHPGQNRGGNKQRSHPPDQHYHRSSKKPPQQQQFPTNGKSRTTSIQSEPKPSVQPSKPAENSGFEEPQFRRGNFDRNSVLRKSQKRSRKNSSASLNNSKALSGGANNESVISHDQSVTNKQVNNEVTIGSKPTIALDKQRKISNNLSSSPMVPATNEKPKLDSSTIFLNDKQSSMMYDAFETTDKSSHNFSTFGKAPERKESTSTSTTSTTVSAIVNEENRKYSAKLNESSQFVSSFLNESNNADMIKISQDTTKSHQQQNRKESFEEIMDSRKLSAIEEMWKSSSNNHRRTSLVENEQRKISSASANVAALLGKLSTPEDIIRIDTKTTFQQPSEASLEVQPLDSNIRRPSSNGFSPTDLVERTTRDKTSPPRKSSSSQETRSTSRSRRSPAKEDCNPSSSSTTTEDLAEEDCGRLI